jgi:hypothetical protein
MPSRSEIDPFSLWAALINVGVARFHHDIQLENDWRSHAIPD